MRPENNELVLKTSYSKAIDQVDKITKGISQIVIDENITDTLDGLDGYSHIIVLYWGNRIPDESRSILKIHPMGNKNYPLKGIFSTFSCKAQSHTYDNC